MKRTVCIILAVLLLGTVNVSAKQNDYAENYNDFSVGDAEDALDNETREFMEENGLNLQDSDWVNKLEVKNVFSYIFSLFKSGFKGPLKSLLIILCLIIVSSLFTCVWQKERAMPITALSNAAVALTVAGDLWKSVVSGVDTVKSAASFMLGFIPVFIGVTAASGKTVTAASSGAVLLLCANLVSYVAAFIILPVMGGHLSISTVSGVSPLIKNSGLADTLKKVCLWVLSLVTTVFLGVLGVQTAVNGAADTAALKTAKFILGTSVPIAGSALSEAASSVAASLSFLRSSVGIYGVVALTVMMLPIIADILLWRFSLNVSAGAASLFGQDKLSSLLKAVDGTLSCLLGILLLCLALFIISLTVVLSVK